VAATRPTAVRLVDELHDTASISDELWDVYENGPAYGFAAITLVGGITMGRKAGDARPELRSNFGSDRPRDPVRHPQEHGGEPYDDCNARRLNFTRSPWLGGAPSRSTRRPR